MENVVLVIHLILALCLIGVVLLQRSEGGGLGMGGSGSVMTGRQAAGALAKLTWVFAAGFFVTSLTLTVLATRNAAVTSVMDKAGSASQSQSGPAPVPQTKLPSAQDLLPPSPTGTTGTGGAAPATTAPAGSDAPTAPPRAGN